MNKTSNISHFLKNIVFKIFLYGNECFIYNECLYILYNIFSHSLQMKSTSSIIIFIYLIFMNLILFKLDSNAKQLHI